MYKKVSERLTQGQPDSPVSLQLSAGKTLCFRGQSLFRQTVFQRTVSLQVDSVFQRTVSLQVDCVSEDSLSADHKLSLSRSVFSAVSRSPLTPKLILTAASIFKCFPHRETLWVLKLTSFRYTQHIK